MTQSSSHFPQSQSLLPWPVALLLMLCILPEMLFQLADHGQQNETRLRSLAYLLGAFQPGFLSNYGPLFPGQPLSMFITYGALHTGLGHLTINMVGLIMLGRLTLAHRKSETFLTFYLLSTIGAAEAFAIIGPDAGTMVGASGAIFGLLGVYLIDSGLLQGAAPSPGLPRQIARVLLATLVLILSDLGSSILLGSVVAWQAHAGGFLTGAVIAVISPPHSRTLA